MGGRDDAVDRLSNARGPLIAIRLTGVEPGSNYGAEV
jgi:hypothetical protein